MDFRDKRGVLSMNNEVIQKNFSGGGGRAGVVILLVTTFCLVGYFANPFLRTLGIAILPAETVQSVPPVAPVEPAEVNVPAEVDEPAQAVVSDSFNPSVRNTDDYLVAAQNLPEGKVLTENDMKIVKMPRLRGYELAFYKFQPVVGMKLSHAVPYGQPVLPYHVEESMAARNYTNLSPAEREQ